MTWTDNLKVGDLVVVVSRDVGKLRKVTRITPKQIKVEVKSTVTYEETYWKETGRAIGYDMFYDTHIEEATQERVHKILERQEYKELSKWVREERFTLQQLRDFKKIAEENA